MNETLFLGKNTAYWIELQKRFEKINPENELNREALFKEVVYLRGKINFYESRIMDLHEGMLLKKD